MTTPVTDADFGLSTEDASVIDRDKVLGDRVVRLFEQIRLGRPPYRITLAECPKCFGLLQLDRRQLVRHAIWHRQLGDTL